MTRAERYILAAGALVVAAAIAGTRLVAASWVTLLDNVHWTAGYATAAALAISGWRRATGTARVARRWFALGLTAYTVGQVLWDVQVAIGWNPFPGPSDAFFVLLGPALVAGALPRAREGRNAARLDVAAITIAVATLVLALYLPRAASADGLTTVVLVAYPALLLGAAGTVLVAVVHQQRATRGTIAMGVAILAKGLLWMEWNRRTLDGTLADATLLNYGFSVVAIGLGLAAGRWDPEPAATAHGAEVRARLARLLPLGFAASAAAAVGVSSGLPPLTRSALSLGAVIVLAIAVVRQSLMLDERERWIVAERLAQASAQRFRQLAEHIDEVFVLADRQGVPCYVSPAFARVFGVAPGEWTRAAWLDRVDPADRDVVASRLGQAGEQRYRVRRDDGSSRWVRDRRVLLEIEGQPGVAAVIEDITDRVDADQRQALLERQLTQAQKLEALGTLAGGIAHDFNNILMGVYGHAQLCTDEPLAAPVRASIDDILAGCERGRDLVRRLLQFSRQRDVAVVPVHPEEVIAEVASLLRAALPKTIRLRIDATPGLPRIVADAAQLHQVVMNLATNAWHAIGDATGTIAIAIRTARRLAGPSRTPPCGEYVTITVTDDGCGMDEATKRRIFEPFFTTRSGSGGTGLGLPVVHGIVTAHGGAIEVESSPGRGTSFTVYVPVCAGAEAPAQATAIAPREGGGGREILVVDDEPVIARALAMQLQRLGWVPTTAGDPERAIELVAAGPRRFAVVIADYSMPSMNGVVLGQRLTELAAGLPFVISTGASTDELVGQPGVSAVLHKPYDRETLATVLCRVAPANGVSVERYVATR